ncbi:MAG: PQQ-dependent sugar dehydrogenase [Anaerolineales bacterium]|nr:PQQ-dependent sugar dehydrogenase [Anaerolineales bacterium]
MATFRRILLRTPMLPTLLLAAFALMLAWPPTAPDAQAQGVSWPTVELELVTSDISAPTYVTAPADGSGRLFIVQQNGLIRIFQNGAMLNTPFLNVSTLISTGSERGLLSMAFAPDYAENGRFYINYTNSAGDTVVARYLVSADPNVADPASAQIILTVDQDFSNHNGGQLQFGPDGYLYIGMGDGGSGGDPNNRAQDPQQLLGKMLRINVEAGNPATYTIPASNPFVGSSNTLDEIWALGVRNPWRFSFDRATGDLYIADVGQNIWEEVNVQPANSGGGENWGWRCYEATHAFNLTGCQGPSAYDFPVLEYNHSGGRCSVTGGYVAREGAPTSMHGFYFFADFCSGEIWAAREVAGTWQQELMLDTALNITTFGEDEAGDLYVAGSGQLFRLSAEELPLSESLYLPLVAK